MVARYKQNRRKKMGSITLKVKDQIPGSTVEQKGPVMNFNGFQFLKTPEGGWITWFLKKEAERLFDLCAMLEVPYELGYVKEK